MPARYEALLEEWPREALLYIPKLPGFIASAATREDVLELSLEALDLHLAWLTGHGHPPSLPHHAGIVVVEALTAPKPGIGPRFDADLVDLPPDELEHALSLGRVVLSDTIEAYDEVAALGADQKELDRILRHVAELDRWYAARLEGVIEATATATVPDPFDAMIQAAAAFEDAVDEHVGSRRPQISIIGGEEWTLTKAIRRRTAHLREHCFEIVDLGSTRDDEE